MKTDNILDALLIFMKNEVENHGQLLSNVAFDFSSSEAIHMKALSKIKSEGKDLTAFKKKIKFSDNLIVQILNKALTDGYVKHKAYGDKYKTLVLTELGSARAESVKHNKKTFFRRGLNNFREKLFVPIVIAVLTVMIVNYISGNQADKNIKQLKEDIK
jgi:hypothetical protein